MRDNTDTSSRSPGESSPPQLDAYGVANRLAIHTNVASNIHVPTALKGINLQTKNVIRVEEVDQIAFPPSEPTRRLADHRVAHSTDSLTVRYPTDPLGRRIEMRLSNLLEAGTTELTFTAGFKHHADLGHLFESALTATLLNAGLAPIHAAGFVIDGETIALTSIGRMGKTSTVLSVSEKIDEYLGDNILFLDAEGNVYAWPTPIGIYPGTAAGSQFLQGEQLKRYKRKQRIGNHELLAAGLKKLFGYHLVEHIEPSVIAPIVTESTVDELYVLNSGRDGYSTLGQSEAVRKLITGTDIELSPDSYFIRLFDFFQDRGIELYERRREILVSAVDKIELAEFSASNAAGYADMLRSRH